MKSTTDFRLIIDDGEWKMMVAFLRKAFLKT